MRLYLFATFRVANARFKGVIKAESSRVLSLLERRDKCYDLCLFKDRNPIWVRRNLMESNLGAYWAIGGIGLVILTLFLGPSGGQCGQQQ